MGSFMGTYVIDLPEIPLNPAQSSVEWTTEVSVQEDISGYN
jgi:hypothetical protein